MSASCRRRRRPHDEPKVFALASYLEVLPVGDDRRQELRVLTVAALWAPAMQPQRNEDALCNDVPAAKALNALWTARSCDSERMQIAMSSAKANTAPGPTMWESMLSRGVLQI